MNKILKINFQHNLGFKRLFLRFLLVSMIQFVPFTATASYCLIGGLIRANYYGKCPTTNNSCSAYTDGFLCGAVFNRVCIPRLPIENLSRRCQMQSSRQSLSPENYSHLITNDPIKTYCVNNPSNNLCNPFKPFLSNVINQTTRSFSFKSPLATVSVSNRDSQNTEARTVCTTGQCQGINPDTNIQVIRDLQNLTESSEEFSDIISNLLYTRANCKNCSSHSGCYLRSCFRSNNDRCIRTKPISRSTRRCAGYAVHSLTITLRKIVGCDADDKNGTLTEQCKYNTNKSNICNSNFVLHSALCALNLDGVDRINKNTISNRRVRRTCNRSSTAFPTHYKGIPLFKELSNTININDPASIPTGSIVVMKSRSKHGHIEIKTNNTNCGPNKNETCFCSDFCTNRDPNDYGTNKPFKPQAVFQINPDLLKILEEQEQQRS